MSTGSRRVLVVDDDATARIMMRAVLSKAGFLVDLAAGGDEALRQFRAEPADIVMLDVDMPAPDGHEVCRRLRAEFGQLLPIVMVTGMDDLTSVQAAFVAGATDFIAKPINWALLPHRVHYLLRGYATMLELRSAQASNAALLNAIPDLLFELDDDGRFLDFRSPRADLLAAPPELFLGRVIEEVLPRDAATICKEALRQAKAVGHASGQQYRLDLERGPAWFELSVARKDTEPGQKARFVALARDITDRKLAEERTARLAYFDSLTGLPNRQSFLDRVDREIRRAAQRHGQLALLFMDLDGFKHVNDTMGHAVGDLLLQAAAERLSEGLRPGDVVSRTGWEHAGVDLARLGGDEFTALIMDVEHVQDVLAVTERVAGLMRQPFRIAGHALTLTASIGVALYPQDGTDGATLLKHADTAMYEAKKLGRDNTQLYNRTLTDLAQKRLQMDSGLRGALAAGEFMLEYQPQVDVATGRASVVEALIRWRHPRHGLFSPLDFIPLAEENGLIMDIGEWVLRTACADLARWREAGHGVRVAVNLSPFQLKAGALVDAVMRIVAETGIPADALELEVTESATLERGVQALALLRALSERGVGIALDDFGTGFSSLSHLTELPIANLKLDRSFIARLLDDAGNRVVVEAVLAMAGKLGLRVTAEGVETCRQARSLVTLRCDRLQGYWFSRPVPAAQVPDLLERLWPLSGPTCDRSASA